MACNGSTTRHSRRLYNGGYHDPARWLFYVHLMYTCVMLLKSRANYSTAIQSGLQHQGQDHRSSIRYRSMLSHKVTAHLHKGQDLFIKGSHVRSYAPCGPSLWNTWPHCAPSLWFLTYFSALHGHLNLGSLLMQLITLHTIVGRAANVHFPSMLIICTGTDVSLSSFQSARCGCENYYRLSVFQIVMSVMRRLLDTVYVRTTDADRLTNEKPSLIQSVTCSSEAGRLFWDSDHNIVCLIYAGKWQYSVVRQSFLLSIAVCRVYFVIEYKISSCTIADAHGHTHWWSLTQVQMQSLFMFLGLAEQSAILAVAFKDWVSWPHTIWSSTSHMQAFALRYHCLSAFSQCFIFKLVR